MYRPILALIALVIAVPASAAPITFDFNATTCTTVGPGFPCVLTNTLIATLTLPNTTSSGSGVWDGTNPPVYTGDNFTLTYGGPIPGPYVVPPANTNPDPGCVAGLICFFDISWNEINSQLTAVSIEVHGLNQDIGLPNIAPGASPFGLTGGSIASDGDYNGCQATQCVVTGSWETTSILPAPEPGTALLLVIPLALVVLARDRGVRLTNVAAATSTSW